MLELRSFSHKIKSIGEAEATKAECFEIIEKLIKYRKDVDLKNKQWRFLHSENYPLTNIKLKSSKVIGCQLMNLCLNACTSLPYSNRKVKFI